MSQERDKQTLIEVFTILGEEKSKERKRKLDTITKKIKTMSNDELDMLNMEMEWCHGSTKRPWWGTNSKGERIKDETKV